MIPILYGGLHQTTPVRNAPALEAQKVCAQYAGAAGLALQDVSLCVQPGTRVALVGPNGSGKSTLLKAAAGLLPIRSGRILLHGNLVGAAHTQVAYLPQRGELDWKFPISVRKLVLTGQIPGGHSRTRAVAIRCLASHRRSRSGT